MKVDFSPSLITPLALPSKKSAAASFDVQCQSATAKTGLSNYKAVGSIIPFCAIKKASPDDVKREAREVCSRCHYGKANILNNLDKLKVIKEDGKLFLDGYYTEEDDAKIMTGICEELAHKAGTILGERFKKDYAPLVVAFSGTKYHFASHVCILMIKRGEKNDAQLEAIRNLNYNENLSDIEDYDGDTLFNGAIFIDPSFGIVCDIEKLPASYEDAVSFNSFERNNPYTRLKEINPGSNNYLGYLKDICPELQKTGMPPKAMVAFILPEGKDCLSEGKPDKPYEKKLIFRIYFPDGENCIQGKVKDLEKTLPKSKFTAFMAKLENEFQNQTQG